MKSIFTITILVISFSSLSQVNRGVREIFKDKTSIENPFDLRDPFKAPLSKRVNDRDDKDDRKSTDGIYTNIAPMGELEINKLTIVGVIIGKERYALAKIEGRKDTVKLVEGARIGKDRAELKAIHPGGVILVEKLVNVYGEEEYLETVIPISK
jgi:type IV pilus assembly protein PilP